MDGSPAGNILLLWGVLWAGSLSICGSIFSGKDYSFWLGFFIALFFTPPVAALIGIFLPPRYRY